MDKEFINHKREVKNETNSKGIGLILVLALVTVLSVQARLVWAEDKPVKLKVGNVFPPPETSLMSEILKSWEDEVTKRTKGLINLEEISTIEDVISKLDEKYPGFKDIFLPPGGIFNSRTAITLTKVGQPGSAVIDQKQKIEAGDVLLFW